MKKIYTSMLLALSALPLAAEHLTPAQALQRLRDNSPRRAPAVVAAAGPKCVASLPELYVFASDAGYMVLPADDVARPLLAYGADSYDPSNPLLAFWLETYSAEIRAARSARNEAGGTMRVSRNPVAPLTRTRWNQGDPFNGLCPELDGRRCVTGCVATAMAQLMRFHQWPPKGSGSHSYEWASGNRTLSFNYEATEFDFAQMPDVYGADATDAQKTAVATLMYAAGVAVNMDYTPQESGAISRNMGRAFLENFNYDKALWMPQRDYYGLSEWEDLIYNELAEGRPVLYGGTGAAGGHQFIADGYSADGYFHFNWGWGGMSDGYFLLTALDPPSLGIGGGAGGFNYNQSALLGLQPPVAGSEPVYVIYCGGEFVPSAAQVTLGSQMAFGGGFYNYGFTTTPAGTELGIMLKPTTPAGQPVYVTSATAEIPPAYGARELAAVLPADLPEGTYSVTPAFRIPGHDWQTIRTRLSDNGQLTATVSGNTATFTAPEAPELQIEDLTLTSPLYWSKAFTLTFTAVNAKSSEYYGGLAPVLLSADGSEILAQATPYPVDIAGGASIAVNYAGTFTANTIPAAGTCLLALFNPATSMIEGNPIEVTLNAAPARTEITVGNLRLISPAPIADHSAVEFAATVECTEGYFAGTLKAPVFAPTGGSSLAVGTTTELYLEAGQSRDISFTIDLSSLPKGDYMLALYDGQQPVSDYVEFALPPMATAIETLHDTSPDALLYDLTGRRVVNPSSPGLYLSTRCKHLLIR